MSKAEAPAPPVLARPREWSTLLGHARELQALCECEQPFPALLFCGPEGVGKTVVAMAYAARLNCLAEGHPECDCLSCRKIRHGNHPDLMLTEREVGKLSLGVAEVRDGLAKITSLPYEARFRVWIIAEADRLTDEAQNALLKTLEEPPERTLIILVADQESRLLPTVVSRCRFQRFTPVDQESLASFLQQRQIMPDQARVLARMAEGRPGKALRLAEDQALWKLREETVAALQRLPRADLWETLEVSQLLDALRGHPPDPRRDLEEVLRSCQSWYRDLMLLAAGADSSQIQNLHHLNALQSLAGRIPAQRLESALAALEEAHLQLRSNVLSRFILQSLCMTLARIRP